MKKITKKQFKLFEKWCWHYIGKLGLARYSFKIDQEDLDKSAARCMINQSGAWVSIKINCYIVSRENKSMNEHVRICALHECLHVLLSHYRYLCDSRYGVGADDVECEEEKVIKVLEKLL